MQTGFVNVKCELKDRMGWDGVTIQAHLRRNQKTLGLGGSILEY